MKVFDATLASASFVCANLRPEDHAEAFCQLAPGLKTHELAAALLMSGENYVVGRSIFDPVCFFGVSPLNAAASSVWAIGTIDFVRAVPAMTRFFAADLAPRLIASGTRLLEARAMASHLTAHQWIHLTGGRQSGDPYEYGRNGEKFVTFHWTRDALSLHQGKRRRA